MTARERVIAQIRARRALGMTTRRRRIPRQQQPNAIRASYFAALRKYVNLAGANAQRYIAPFLADMLDEAAGRPASWPKLDAKDTTPRRPLPRRVKEAIDRAATATKAAMKPHELHAVAKKFGTATSDFQKEQLARQTRAAMGIDLFAAEPNIAPILEEFAATNVDLITSIPDVYFDDLRLEVEEAVVAGTRAETLADTLAERFGIMERRAALIARDQIGKLFGQLNGARQEALGISGYVWRGVLDNREREEHEAREGDRFTWDDPPEDGHPGEAINCRCYAEPDFTEILDESADEEAA